MTCIAVDVSFSYYSSSKKTPSISGTSCSTTVSWLKKEKTPWGPATQRCGTCDNSDAYSFDLKTDRLFPDAELIQKKDLETENLYSDDLKTEEIFPEADIISQKKRN